MVSEGVNVRSVGNTQLLNETALIEALNLKFAIEWRAGNRAAAATCLTDMPPRTEEGEFVFASIMSPIAQTCRWRATMLSNFRARSGYAAQSSANKRRDEPHRCFCQASISPHAESVSTRNIRKSSSPLLQIRGKSATREICLLSLACSITILQPMFSL